MKWTRERNWRRKMRKKENEEKSVEDREGRGKEGQEENTTGKKHTIR
jgi:hypothetical protein